MFTRFLSLSLLAVTLFSCGSSAVLIGTVNVISHRNIDSRQNYVLLKRYAGGEGLRHNKAATIEAALDNVIKSTPGGEYLMNAKLYRVGTLYSVEGDVWGLTGKNDIRGFKVNDQVVFKELGKYGNVVRGVITGFIDGNKCYVKYTDKRGKEHEVEMKYEYLSQQ